MTKEQIELVLKIGFNGEYTTKLSYDQVRMANKLVEMDALYLTTHTWSGKWAYVRSDKYLLPIDNNVFDDCLDCGAVGNNPCKENCPNKN